MACRLIHQPLASWVGLQHDSPSGAGSGWTTDDVSPLFGTVLYCRVRLLVDADGGDACTAELSLEWSEDGATWTEFSETKFANPQVFPSAVGWYDGHAFTIPYPGTYTIRCRATYDGEDTILPTTFNVTVPYTPEATADAPSREVIADAPSRSVEASLETRTTTAGVPSRAVAAEAEDRSLVAVMEG